MSDRTFDWRSLGRFGRVTATFEPKRLDNVKPEVAPFVGLRGEWMVWWLQYAEDGDPYPGQFALGLVERKNDFPWWVPEEDLVDVEVVPRGIPEPVRT